MQLSVVICTHDRYAALAQSVQALVGSPSFVDSEAELVVVENTPPSRRQKMRLPSGNRVRRTICETPGLSHARNAGIRAAEGEVIAFLDDDALVDENWCAAILRRMAAEPEILAVGGKVDPLYSGELPPWFDSSLAGYLSCIDWGPAPRALRPGEWIVGANMAFRRETFTQHGLFDVQLGRKGAATLLSNEETALLARIGPHRVFYDPDMAVRHIIPTERLTIPWFRSRVYWQAVSDLVAGHARADDPDTRREYGRVVAQLEAEHRNLNALTFEPRDGSEFRLQLRAIYLAAIVLAGGGA